MGKISALIMYSRGTVGMSHYKQRWSAWYSVWNLGWVVNLKYIGLELTLILLTCRIWWAPNNASKGQMGFSLAFIKG